MKNFRMILIGCFLMMAACVKAQNISGQLVDEQHKPLPYANIVLLQADSTFVNGTITDETAAQSTVSKATVTVYKAPDFVTPPLAAKAAVKTGSNSFP